MEEEGTPEELLQLQDVILGGGIEAVMDQVILVLPVSCLRPKY